MKDIYKVLDEIGVDYLKREHPAVFTCEEADQYYKDVEGGHSKNLFLRNKKGDTHYLVIIESSKKVDLKDLKEKLGESKLSFASEERLMRFLGLEKGSVSPFGLINDTEHEVVVVMDKDLLKYDKLHYHPNVNTATLEVSLDGFRRFLEWCGNELTDVEF